jgi:predicted RNA-binding Zn-ribbon protein involved in translation (DUF1610 family)
MDASQALEVGSTPTKTTIVMEALTCDSCGFYPIKAEHAHYICPECGYKTKCCEGGVC